VASEQLDHDDYEHRIFTTGQVSTRADSWHDLFNALVWMRFPRIKTAMNKLHYHAGAEFSGGRRGRLRDALTLFDECGVIVFSGNLELLTALVERRWSDAFKAEAFPSRLALSICGHAILEKYLAPYKAMTANALLVHVNADCMKLPRPELLDHLDRGIAKQISNGLTLTGPACLSPLPLAGIAGWWPLDEQNDDRFYNDPQVFRPAPARLKPAPILRLDGLSNV